jgi:cysteine sulfinate desulfinase/cysteine desulfurase-like protein
MRIACLLLTGAFNGAENMTLLAATYMSRNHEVMYCCPEGPIKEYITDTGVTYVPVDKVSVKTVKHIMKTLKPDIFLVLDNKAGMVAALAGVLFHISRITGLLSANLIYFRSVCCIIAKKLKKS